MMKKMNYRYKGSLVFAVLAVALAPVLLAGCGAADNASGVAAIQQESAAAAEPQLNGSASDVLITVSELSQIPSFYSAKADGTDMEIIALLAPDGSVRTAFNTCQVCYSSGRGYYKAEGEELVCQNCGNRFTGDAVGVMGGGCNPVPITEDERSEKDGVITIPGALLSEAREIFANWK